MSSDLFHPLTAGWFAARFGQPTEPQRLGWPEIAAGRHTLIAAPTGSGKTLAAFLACIDRLVSQAASGNLPDEIQTLYVSPLKALSNDIQRNLQQPLAELAEYAAQAGAALPEIRVALRTSDTPSHQRQAMLRRPPHILVTTPESLYLLLTSAKSRETLRSVQTVIVDEIHALARDKRGSHLALSLERLAELCPRPPARVGLSATQRPIEEIARFLVGAPCVDADGRPDCRIIDTGHARVLDLGVVVPTSPLEAICSNETWDEIYAQLVAHIGAHRSTLVFVNTRRLAERVAHRLGELLGEEAVASHHGSLSKELRLSAERRLKAGKLRAIVATASLELGIDVGYIDLVCQIGSPRSIAVFLQRVGRSGHSLSATPKGRLFPLTRDGLLECLALIRAVRGGRLDAIRPPRAPLDILAQQMVAAVACGPLAEEELWNLCRRAWPYRDLSREDFTRVVRMLSEGVAPGRRNGAHLHRDAVHGQLRPRKGARLSAITGGGAIPDNADYRVVTDDGVFVGTVNEDFAIESLAGDVFLLGNSSWRIRHVRSGVVTVSDAQGAPASVPFWLGEAPGRTHELSAELASLREELAGRTPPAAAEWLAAEVSDGGGWATQQAVDYTAAQQAALGLVPTQRRIVFERFFDEAGGMQLVIHAPLGAEINRAWGLALRKRFCRSFDFELQASADDNGIVLSLGPQHSFPVEQMFRMLNPQNGPQLLTQALLAAPMFNVRWRWNVTRALAVLRHARGRKVPPPLQRFRSDDLLAAVFPQQTACLENIVGDIEIPKHPLVDQTLHDCLHEAMDLPRWTALLEDIAAGRVELVARDTREPSPFAHEILNANPYAFLDPAPLEERRARAVTLRRTLDTAAAGDLTWLDPAAIEQVRREAWPLVRDADELHDALCGLVALPAAEAIDWRRWHDELCRAGRATTLALPGGMQLWAPAERLALALAVYPDAALQPPLELPPELTQAATAAEGHLALVRGRLDMVGPVTAERLAADLRLRPSAVEAALEALEGEGFALRGRFTPPADNPAAADRLAETSAATKPGVEWCQRRLLARIHRLTLAGARRRVQPAPPQVYWRYLCQHQHAAPAPALAGRAGLRKALEQLAGLDLPAAAWECDILPARVRDYDPAWLDDLTLGGEVVWGRLGPPRRDQEAPPWRGGLTRVVPVSLCLRDDVVWLLPLDRGDARALAGGAAQGVLDLLREHGALFTRDLLSGSGLLPAQLQDALGELAALGLVTADGLAPIRTLADGQRRAGLSRRRALAARRGHPRRGGERGGRWAKFPGLVAPLAAGERAERWARLLLLRYGVVFRDLVSREPLAPAWSDVAQVYRRREAQGELYGGRFVDGVAGEQFALPSAVEALRQIRDTPPTGQWLCLAAVDPLNLSGVLPGVPRAPAQGANSLCLRDGELIACQVAGETRLLVELDDDQRQAISRALGQNTLARQRAAQLHIRQQPRDAGAVT